MEKFSKIKTRNDLADFLKIPHSKLTHILYVKTPASYYETFEIPKKSGGTRTICAPSGDLKNLQSKLALALEEYQNLMRAEGKTVSNISHGFEKGKSIITNSKIHRNKRFVLNLDLQDFFSSFHFGRVAGYFEKNKDFLLPHDVAVIIAQITCYNGCLPQGAPTSPIITNMICQILDMRVLRIAKKYKLDYTRYADDLTFSTNCSGFIDTQDSFISELSDVISKAGFSINENKTRLLFKDSKQEVTGLIVNKKVNVSRAYAKATRAMAHQLYVNGEFTIDGVPGSINQLEGRFSFIDQLDHYNNKIDGIKHNAYNLCGREKQYRAFLFFKYFFNNDMPLIITEGKTDIRYIKAALKKQYEKYPALIEKGENDNFVFKVNFLNRSKKLKYFFDFEIDGADAMKKLYQNYFTGKDNNYYKYFCKTSGHRPISPVIFIFDNETTSDRPLKKFLCSNNLLSESIIHTLQEKLIFQLQPSSSLYLLTNPLVGEKNECEIEDLFSPDLLSLRLGNKTFSREKSYDKNKYYGKDIFSSYVYMHYKEIDFSKFTPFLDALNSIVENSNTTSANSKSVSLSI